MPSITFDIIFKLLNENLILFSFKDTLTSPSASSNTFLNSKTVFLGMIIPVISSAPWGRGISY